MKKIISLFTVFSILLSCIATSFATSSGETIVIDGNQYTVEKTVTDTYSQAILKDVSTNKIVASFTYYLDSGVLVDDSTNQAVPSALISIKSDSLSFLNDDDKYVYSHTERYSFSFARYSVTAIAAAIASLGGPGTSAIAAAITLAVTDGLDGVYVIQKCYSYKAKEGSDYYHYSKRITSIYGDNDALLGGPWTTYQKIREK